MANFSVDTDLSVANGGTVNAVTGVAAITELGGTGSVSGEDYSDMKSIQDESDVFIEGTGCCSGGYTTNNPDRGGGVVDNGTNFTLAIDEAVFVWLWWISPSALDSYSVAGQFVAIGSAPTTSMNIYPVSGNDLDPSPLGGWYCFPVHYSSTAYEHNGTAPTTYRYIGGGISATQQSRGLTHWAIDAVRKGRGQILCTGDDTTGTFALIYSGLEAIDNGSFGIFDSVLGSYFMQGLLQFGDNTSATGEVGFSDSNANINIRNTPAVLSGFNRIECQNGSTQTSNITLTSCSFSNIGANNSVAPSASRGDWENVDDVNLTLDSCSFTDMGTFIFQSNTAATSSVFRRCSQITQGGATFNGCTIAASNSATAMVVSDASVLGNSSPNTFVGDGTTTPGHAVDLGTFNTGGSVTVNWYNELDNGTTNQSVWEGTTQTPTAGTQGSANSAITVNVFSGTALKISVASGATIPTVQNTGTGTLEITANEVTLTITVVDITDNSVIEGAMVYCTNSGATATYINKVETNASGQVSFTGSLASAQTLAGNVRAATPDTKAYTKYYKSSPIVGSFSNTQNTDITISLIPDE